MPAAPEPANERQRLDALWSYEILDTAPEAAFDALTTLASQICATPIATVTLVDESRQWFKSRCGFDGPDATGREIAFCAYAILRPQLLEVHDASNDPRFADNPLVTGDTHYRFYAGMPLVAPGGLALGTICVIDREPRVLSDAQRAQLENLAQAALGLIVTRVRRSAADDRRLGLLDASLNLARARADQLAALHRYAVSLRGVRGADDVLTATLAAARTVCRTSRAQVVNAPLPALPTDDPQIVCVLIRSQQSIEHALILTRDGDRPYSLSERALLEIIADIAGLALEAARAAVA